MRARRPWAWPLVPLYAAGLAIKDSLRGAGILKTHRLYWPVISVGSLSAGGAGKTPVVIALANLLRERGLYVDVLTRGYGREGDSIEQIQPEGEDPALRFGDEPVLIAKRTGAPVWVGPQRFEAGTRAEAAHTQQTANIHLRAVHLLDDGFQHRQLFRTVDIVLVTEADLNDTLLPAGNLREPLKALARASIIVLREEESERVLPRLQNQLRGTTAIWTIRRRLSFSDLQSVLSTSTHTHLAFCAIARPSNFIADIRAANISVIDAVTFPDHHRYTMVDVDNLTARLRDYSANAFITTEKDAVKLSPTMRTKLEAYAPLVIARLDAYFIDEVAVVRDLEVRLA